MVALPHDHHNDSEHIREHMPKTEDFQTVSGLFKQLSDPVRVKIFWLLCHTEECVLNIAAIMDMSSPAVAHHLKLLKDAGLIEGRKDGKEMYYKATRAAEASALHIMIEQLMTISCPESHKH